MSRNSSKKNNYFAAVIFVLMLIGLAGIWFFILAPQYATIKNIDGRITEIKDELSSNRRNVLSGNVKKLQEQLYSAGKELSVYIVSPSKAMDLTVDIAKIASQAGVKGLHSTNRMLNSYSTINECQHVREGRMQINFKSSFDQFAKLTNMLERNKPVIFIDYFKITRSAEDSTGSSHKVQMTLTFFVGQDSLSNIMASED
jgi:hypothetical protein